MSGVLSCPANDGDQPSKRRGSSLTVGSTTPLRQRLAPVTRSLTIDAKTGRRSPGDVPRPYSGVLAVRDVRASTGDAASWIVALGTNDLPWVHYPGQYGTTSAAAATNIISSVVNEINRSGKRQIWWVNVSRRDYPAAGASARWRFPTKTPLGSAARPG